MVSPPNSTLWFMKFMSILQCGAWQGDTTINTLSLSEITILANGSLPVTLVNRFYSKSQPTNSDWSSNSRPMNMIGMTITMSAQFTEPNTSLPLTISLAVLPKLAPPWTKLQRWTSFSTRLLLSWVSQRPFILTMVVASLASTRNLMLDSYVSSVINIVRMSRKWMIWRRWPWTVVDVQIPWKWPLIGFITEKRDIAMHRCTDRVNQISIQADSRLRVWRGNKLAIVSSQLIKPPTSLTS